MSATEVFIPAPPVNGAVLTVGTRGSPLAMAQANQVVQRLKAAHGGFEARIESFTTTGDRVQDRPLSSLGGKGLFTKELDEALLTGRIDLAVHSMKDMPTVLPAGLMVAAVLEREDPRDAFLSPHAVSLAGLRDGAVVGTASLRRAAQIRAHYPHLRVEPLRGNVQTRLNKLAEGVVDATLLAMAGLNRLGLNDRQTVALAVEEMLPAVAQGAIAVTCRVTDRPVMLALAAINHGLTETCVACERAFLAVLDGSCQTPIAGLAEMAGDTLRFRGLIVKPDGSAHHAIERSSHLTALYTPAQATLLGREAGLALLARAGEDFLRALPP